MKSESGETMALDGILLSRIVPQIASAMPLRIQKIWDISPTEILFQTHGPAGRQLLLISCHSVYNRILFTKRSYPTPDEPGNFVMVLRKYLDGGIMESIEQAGLDRWCLIRISRRNNLGDMEHLKLYVELMGKYANVILVNAEDRIIDALKRIPPFENSRRTIHPGAVFPMMPAQDKKDPFETPLIDPQKSLTAQFSGFSPFLSKETEYRMANGEKFEDILAEIRTSRQLFIANDQGEAAFHCIELKHCGPCRSYELFEGFDILYYHKEEKDRIRQISGDTFRFVQRQLKHQKTKLPRLLSELDEANDCSRWKTYGELLYAYNITDTKGHTSISLEDFETGKPVTIPLDPKLDGKGNARRCYQKYTKLKKGQVYLAEQIDLCEKEIAYFQGLLEQLDQADFDTASEMKEELIRLGYLKEDRRRRKRKKDTGPKIVHTKAPDGTPVSFGRNNLQNDALTWHLARKNEIWLHAKDYHGAHVVIHDEHPSEETMRFAANIAAFFSAGRQSSSVPVIWCPQRNLKKIPGAKPGMVQLGSYKMIYIDPERETIESLGLI